MNILNILLLGSLWAHFLAGTLIPSLALKPTYLGFQHILKTTHDIQDCGQSNY